jgi:hypothetical protein
MTHEPVEKKLRFLSLVARHCHCKEQPTRGSATWLCSISAKAVNTARLEMTPLNRIGQQEVASDCVPHWGVTSDNVSRRHHLWRHRHDASSLLWWSEYHPKGLHICLLFTHSVRLRQRVHVTECSLNLNVTDCSFETL